MSKYSQIPGATEFVVELREAQTKWDAEGGIVDQFNAKFGTELKSAIPLRKLYHGATVNLKATPASVAKARANGAGWGQIAAALKISEGEAQKLFAKSNSELPVDHRLYTRRDGTLNVHNGAGRKDKAERVSLAIVSKTGKPVK